MCSHGNLIRDLTAPPILGEEVLHFKPVTPQPSLPGGMGSCEGHIGQKTALIVVAGNPACATEPTAVLAAVDLLVAGSQKLGKAVVFLGIG